MSQRNTCLWAVGSTCVSGETDSWIPYYKGMCSPLRKLIFVHIWSRGILFRPWLNAFPSMDLVWHANLHGSFGMHSNLRFGPHYYNLLSFRLQPQVFQPTNIVIGEEALQAFQAVVKTIHTANSVVHQEPQGFAYEVCEECIHVLQEPEKSQAKPAMKVICALLETTRMFLYFFLWPPNYAIVQHSYQCIHFHK